MNFQDCEFYGSVGQCKRPKHRMCPMVRMFDREGAPLIGACPAMDCQLDIEPEVSKIKLVVATCESH